jgi:uncharacterized membrane protein YagU involved in acid resistance
MSDSFGAARPAFMDVDFVLVGACGFLATLVMTTVMYVLPLLGWGQVDLPIWLVRVFTSNPVTVGEVGLVIHLLVGLAYALLFACRVEPRLHIAPGFAGLIFGVALWMFAQVIGVPLLGAAAATLPDAGSVSPGWFAARLGMSSAISSLLAHITYGMALSLVYGQRSDALDGRPTRVWTQRRTAAGASIMASTGSTARMGAQAPSIHLLANPPAIP